MSPLRAVLVVALPVVAEQLLSSLVNLSDMFLAGLINSQALAAVAAVSTVGWLVNILFSVVGAGTLAVVSRSIGASAPAAAAAASGQSVRLAIVWAASLSVLIVLLSPLLTMAIALDDSTAERTRWLLMLQAVGFVPAAVTLIGGQCIKGAGHTMVTMIVMVAVNISNIAVSWALSVGLGMNEWGVIAGTVIAWTVGAVLMVAMLQRQPAALRPALLSGWNWAVCRQIINIGAPACVDNLVTWFGMIAFYALITRIPYGSATELYAAHMVCVRIESLSYLPAMGFAVAAAALVGQNLGAGRVEIATRCGHLAARLGATMCLAMGLMYFLLPEVLLSIFTDDPLVRAYGHGPLMITALGQVHLAWMFIYVSALRGAGYTTAPIVVSMVGMWLIRLPLTGLFCFWLELGLLGAWMAMNLDVVSRGTALAVMFVRKRWAATTIATVA